MHEQRRLAVVGVFNASPHIPLFSGVLSLALQHR
ncbi:hypothetical protein predicted by Glimmer/Critica [Acetobacter ghanensis]|uniref:Uncharacterized protein n=1 Tax=Acetobacter ghanensis TaxID=431306 RepID=A0A0U5F6G6_9PROT|nr:hypothetical protein predicted by Glimmer/Critica [Acetobacter ghanensis]